MHQSLDHNLSSAAEATALRQRIRRALACDLNLPEHDPAVTATMEALALVARQHSATIASRPSPSTTSVTLDSWWRVLTRMRAFTGR